MDRDRFAERKRIVWGKIIWAFIRAGWNPPRPSDRAAHGLLDDLERVRPHASLALSPTESRVLALLADGLTYAEIGEHLGRSRATAKEYASAVYGRLGARNAAHAVAIAMRQGILE